MVDPGQTDRQQDTDGQPDSRLGSIGQDQLAGCLERFLFAVERDGDFSSGQQPQEHPGRAHRHVVQFFEEQQNEGIQEINNRRRPDVRRVGLGEDNLLNFATTKRKDNRMQNQHCDRSEHQIGNA